MKKLRCIFIVIVALGAILAMGPQDPSFERLPFPGGGLTVKMLAEVKSQGEYKIQASMPKADHALGLAEETIPCSLLISIMGDAKPPIKTEVTSLRRCAEYGFANIQYYTGGGWNLAPGKYTVEFTSRETCKVAMDRGATLSIEQNIIHPTERFLGTFLKYWTGIFFITAGLLGLVICELKTGLTPIKPGTSIGKMNRNGKFL
jgi:hypothetical protein